MALATWSDSNDELSVLGDLLDGAEVAIGDTDPPDAVLSSRLRLWLKEFVAVQLLC